MSGDENRIINFRALIKMALIAVLIVVTLVSVRPVQAGYQRALYQIEFSLNCNNPSLCGANLGGFWAWGALYSDGTFDAQLTGCDHSISGAPAGAQHMSADGHWTIVDGMLVITQETDTFTGTFHGTVVENPDVPNVIGPARPGHYGTQDILGFPTMPGVSAQLQVVLVPSN